MPVLEMLLAIVIIGSLSYYLFSMGQTYGKNRKTIIEKGEQRGPQEIIIVCNKNTKVDVHVNENKIQLDERVTLHSVEEGDVITASTNGKFERNLGKIIIREKSFTRGKYILIETSGKKKITRDGSSLLFLKDLKSMKIETYAFYVISLLVLLAGIYAGISGTLV